MKLMSDKLVLVTGASRSIGRATALLLAEHGADVVINYKEDATAADEVVNQIKAAGGLAVAIQADVRKSDQVKALFKEVRSLGKRLDCLVNNAGVLHDNLLMMTREADYERIMDTNLRGTFLCTQYAAKAMMRAGGSIINITSIMGRYGDAGHVPYAASKAGVIGLTLSAAKELGQFGIRVNAVAPGFIDTDMTKNLSQCIREKMADSIHLKKRIGVPEDVAKVILFLASDLSAYVSGQVIGVDGCQVI